MRPIGLANRRTRRPLAGPAKGCPPLRAGEADLIAAREFGAAGKELALVEFWQLHDLDRSGPQSRPRWRQAESPARVSSCARDRSICRWSSAPPHGIRSWPATHRAARAGAWPDRCPTIIDAGVVRHIGLAEIPALVGRPRFDDGAHVPAPASRVASSSRRPTDSQSADSPA